MLALISEQEHGSLGEQHIGDHCIQRAILVPLARVGQGLIVQDREEQRSTTFPLSATDMSKLRMSHVLFWAVETLELPGHKRGPI